MSQWLLETREVIQSRHIYIVLFLPFFHVQLYVFTFFKINDKLHVLGKDPRMQIETLFRKT